MDALMQLDTTKHAKGKEIDRALISGDTALLDSVFDNIDGHLAKVSTHRWHSEAARLKQDLHLKEFRQWVSSYLRRKKNDNSVHETDGLSACNDDKLFSREPGVMASNLKIYLLIAADQLKKPGTDEEACIATLLARRSSIMFWLDRLYPGHPSQDTLLKETKDTIMYAMQTLGLRKVENGSMGLFFGKNEIMRLIDFDNDYNQYREVSEQHHLAWIFAWVCGIRPSSLGDGHLTWGDISISRIYDSEGKFNAGFALHITFHFLKDKHDSISRRSLKFTILSPQDPKLIPFSPVYRLLVILFRRKLLSNCQTVEDLLYGDKHNLTIEDSAQSQAIFLKSSEVKGLDKTASPAKSGSFTPYLTRVADLCGFPTGSTLYSWRNNFATEMVAQHGYEAAGTLMGHVPGSDIVKKHYEDPNANTDFFALASGGDEDSAKVRESRSVALQVAEHVMDVQTRRKTVSTWVEMQPTIIEMRKKGLQSASSPELKRELRRLRTLGNKALSEYSKSEGKKQRTSDDYLAALRKANTNSSSIFDMMQDQLQDKSSGPADENQQFRDLEDEELGESDQVVDEGTGDESGEILAQDFASYVASFFYLMGIGTKLYDPGEARQCQACLDDDTVFGEDKYRYWKTASLYQRHVNSTFHNGFSTWKRQMNLLRYGKDNFHCPYGCGRTYGTIGHLVSHIENWVPTSKNDRKIADLHEYRKKDDGWYEPFWTQDNASEELRMKTQAYDAARRSQEDFDDHHPIYADRKAKLHEKFAGPVPGSQVLSHESHGHVSGPDAKNTASNSKSMPSGTVKPSPRNSQKQPSSKVPVSQAKKGESAVIALESPGTGRKRPAKNANILSAKKPSSLDSWITRG